MVKILTDSVVFQRDELKYKIDVEKSLNTIFKGIGDGPKWLVKQIKNHSNKEINSYPDYIGKHLRQLR